jgi:hypothetical protein
LTEEELQTLMSKNIENVRLRQVRNIFVFSCFTGLAYIDAKRLERCEIVIGIDGEKWIYTKRKKIDSLTRIPLLPVVQDIMAIYKDHPHCLNQGIRKLSELFKVSQEAFNRPYKLVVTENSCIGNARLTKRRKKLAIG